MPTPSTGYAIADVATLRAVVAADRAQGYARLLLDDGAGRAFWVAYFSAATSGDWRPTDNPTTGYWKKLSAAGRQLLTADTTVYVAPSGNSGNTGQSSGSPWDIDTAIAYSGLIDFGPYQFKIKAADGTYNTAGIALGRWSGQKTPILEGNVASQNSCILNASSPSALILSISDNWVVRGFRFQGASSGVGIAISRAGVTGNALTFADCLICVNNQGNSSFTLGGDGVERNLTFSGACGYGVLTLDSSSASIEAGTVAASGTTSFSAAGIWCERGSTTILSTSTFTGTATGQRHFVGGLSVITAQSISGNLLGNVAGTTNSSTGGYYVS